MARPQISNAVVHRRRSLLQEAAWGALGLMALAAVACTARVLKQPHHPVSGVVLVDGLPAEGAVVRLHPLEPTAWAYVAPSAKTKEDGTFQINTLGLRSGATSGQYVATVVWTPTVVDGEVITIARNVVPDHFARAETTPLRVSVGEGLNQLKPFYITCECRDGLGGRFSHASLTTNTLHQISGDAQK